MQVLRHFKQETLRCPGEQIVQNFQSWDFKIKNRPLETKHFTHDFFLVTEAPRPSLLQEVSIVHTFPSISSSSSIFLIEDFFQFATSVNDTSCDPRAVFIFANF